MESSIPPDKRFEAALSYAAALHRRQVRKGTKIPYVSHLLAVTALVLEHGGGEIEAIAALLHDAIEDGAQYHPRGATGVREDIGSQFGPAVLAIVEACTDADTDPKPPWRERKVRYIEHLTEVSESARLVSCADKVHNARSILADYRRDGEKLWARFNPQSGGRDGQLWYYRGLLAAFRALGPTELAGELERTLVVLEELVAGSGSDS